jgi:hypothetical protein
VKVRFAEQAEAQIDTRRSWWRTHRTERELFDDELDIAVSFLRENGSTLPILRQVKGHTIRRVLMPRASCHLYFEVLDEIIVFAAWGAKQRRQPRP